MKSKKEKLSLPIRILIGVVSIPSFILAGMVAVMIVNGDMADVGYFEVVYSLVGIFALYIALTGKRFF